MMRSELVKAARIQGRQFAAGQEIRELLTVHGVTNGVTGRHQVLGTVTGIVRLVIDGELVSYGLAVECPLGKVSVIECRC